MDDTKAEEAALLDAIRALATVANHREGWGPRSSPEGQHMRVGTIG